ncbi:MAG TPA: AAA family ATPase, partial [Acidimicrobiales bacterium]|nr:AAA family ATPase [Acidimicrobiales bacterium]
MQRQRSAVADVSDFAAAFDAVVGNVERVIQGKEDVVRLALVCLVAEGHLLIEDVPGVGKTSLAKALSTSMGTAWRRIQFTPDLLPSDVTGVNVYNRATGKFEFRPGGVFAAILLADEINRASPRTQSALLEAMEERQVTIDSETYRLPVPFMVIATQNPIEHQGTYPLPDSQLDRFLMRIDMGYPDRTSEVQILETHAATDPIDDLSAVVDASDVEAMIERARQVQVAPA